MKKKLFAVLTILVLAVAAVVLVHPSQARAEEQKPVVTAAPTAPSLERCIVEDAKACLERVRNPQAKDYLNWIIAQARAEEQKPAVTAAPSAPTAPSLEECVVADAKACLERFRDPLAKDYLNWIIANPKEPNVFNVFVRAQALEVSNRERAARATVGE